MQNLAASANLQLFSKALQESAQQAGDMPDQQQNPAISAADLQKFMLSQLDQQLYLSQLAGYGNGGADNNNGGANALFSLPQQPVSSGSSDSATTTVSSGSHGQQEEPAHKQSKASSSGGGETVDSLSQRAQLVQQKLMEQFMEAATNGNASMEQQMNGGGGQQSDELSQLMAQLIGGTTSANGGGNAGEQLQHVQQQQNGGGGQQRGDAQSPSQQMSVLDQLQLLQMLGSAGGGGAALADLLAAGAGASLGSAAGLMDNGQLGQQQQSGMGKLQQHHQQNGVGGHHGHGGGGGSAGGSPAKDDTYCEICNKNVCNRYFLKIHLAKKHGIGTASGSPLKTGNGNFFGSGYSSQLDDLPARAQSASLQQHQQHNNRDSPSTAQHQQQQQQRMSQKQSMSSTPGLGSLNGGHGANSSMNDSLSADQQLMSQCIMQQLAVQLELAAQSGNPADRPALIEQILNAGLPLAEMLQQQQQSAAGQQQQQQQTGRVRSSSPQSDLHGCAHCTKQFGSQSALFQHQLTEHIGTTEQQQQQQQAANDQLNNSLAGMRWPAELGGGVPPQQQQQILGQLLSSAAGHFPIPTSNPSSLLLSPFGQLNPTELDGAAMLAKLSAELAAVSQPQGHQQQPSHLHQNGALQTPLQVTKLQAQQPPPQKRQYSSTSKNFCDLCNKEVCNKYFLRTHMLKMHNIVIDENKVVIANIDTAEKERKGEVKFRCEICLTSLANRDQLRTHKREVHGMQAPLGGTLSTPPKAGGGGGLRMMGMGGAMETTPECRFTAAAQQQQTTAFPFLSSQEHQQQQQREHREAMMERQQQQPGMLKFEPATAAANDENQPTAAEGGPDSQQPQQQQSALPSSVKQLLSQLIGDPLLAPAAGRLSALSSKRQSEEQQDHFQQQHPQQLPTQQRQISDNGDTNNNSSTISCRFCGLCLESEEHLQLHQLMDHMDLMRPEQPEDLITQVALQMAEANSHKASALRKSSAASSGASSSSAASSSAAGAHQLLQMTKTPSSTSAAAAATTNVPCPQCKRTYKSAQKMEQHQRIVHHPFMAKISPTKRPVISPKKIAKLVKGFSCMKCQRRFPTKAECNEHVITAHLRPKTEEDAADNSPRMKRAKMEESLGEEDADADEAEAQQRLLARWVREEQDEAASSSDLGRLVVDEAEEELEEKEESEGTDHGAGGGGGGRSDQKSRPTQKQAKEGEKHSHTSGSTSPVSVHASSSGLPPEGFAHPAADHQKPFVLQSFTVRPVLPGGGGGLQNAEPNGSVVGESALPDELIAYLPVRHTLSQPLRITLELQPNPQLDSEVRHL